MVRGGASHSPLYKARGSNPIQTNPNHQSMNTRAKVPKGEPLFLGSNWASELVARWLLARGGKPYLPIPLIANLYVRRFSAAIFTGEPETIRNPHCSLWPTMASRKEREALLFRSPSSALLPFSGGGLPD